MAEGGEKGGKKGGAGWLEPGGPFIYYYLHSGQAQRPWCWRFYGERCGGEDRRNIPPSGQRWLPRSIFAGREAFPLRDPAELWGAAHISMPQFPPENTTQRNKEHFKPCFKAARLEQATEAAFLCWDFHPNKENNVAVQSHQAGAHGCCSGRFVRVCSRSPVRGLCPCPVQGMRVCGQGQRTRETVRRSRTFNTSTAHLPGAPAFGETQLQTLC